MKLWIFGTLLVAVVAAIALCRTFIDSESIRTTPETPNTVEISSALSNSASSQLPAPAPDALEGPLDAESVVQNPAPAFPLPDEWTEKNLAGTSWKGTNFDFSFAKDGTWYMAGRAASKWRIEGRRIRLFDEKGEVHHIEIVGNELMFNGEPIGIPVARD